MLAVLVTRLGKNQNVIQINKHKKVNHVTQNIIYQGLKNSWGISESKGHHLVLIVSRGGVKSCLPLITLSDANEVISIAKVQLRKSWGPCRRSKAVEIIGRGYRLRMVILFRLL